MKKNSKYIVLTAAIALCAGSSLPFLAGSSTLNPERDSVKSEVPYCVTSPSVPDKITFAGQAIDLLRYDHRERMDRELMSFTYMHSTTMLMVKRANRYFPVIEPILKANGFLRWTLHVLPLTPFRKTNVSASTAKLSPCCVCLPFEPLQYELAAFGLHVRTCCDLLACQQRIWKRVFL